VYIIFIAVVKWKLVEKAFWAIPVLLIANFALANFMDLPWFYYGNFLFTGLPLFLLGHWLHRVHEKLPANPVIWCYVFCAGIVLTFAEVVIMGDGYCFIGSIVMAVALLLFSVNYTYEARNTALLNILKRFSTYIFIIHCGIRDIFQAFLNRYQIVLDNNIIVVLIIIITLLVCIAWDFFATFRKNTGSK
jgi:hypothetical protein